MPKPKSLLDKRWPWLLAGAALVVMGLASYFDARVGPASRRPVGSPEDIAALAERSDLNVLFILIDTLRSDRLGAYGYERDTSPTLDLLASEGVRFSRHLAQSSWTKCSMASLWTSLNPARAGITRFDQVIPTEAQLPAEILKAAGLRTAGIYRNGWVAPTFGFDQGFDFYTRPAASPMPPELRASNPTLSQRGTDEDVVAASVEFLRAHGDERWFLYLHLMDVHEYLYDSESALFGGSYSDVYDNSIRWTDRTLGILLEYLDEWGYRENTIIAITSDHGEAFDERGFEGHAREVYRETTEVPFILSLPFRLPEGIVVDARTRNIDVWPTLLALLGLQAPPDIDGESLVGDILASARGQGPAADERIAVAHLDQTWGQRQMAPRATVAVAEGRHRYVRTIGPRGTLEDLFDAGRDPRELEQRSEQEPERVEQLRALADRYLESEEHWQVQQREIGELELNQLRALGYAIP